MGGGNKKTFSGWAYEDAEADFDQGAHSLNLRLHCHRYPTYPLTRHFFETKSNFQKKSISFQICEWPISTHENTHMYIHILTETNYYLTLF